MVLPKFIFLKSNDNKKYLRYSKREIGSVHSVLHFPSDVKDKTDQLVASEKIEFQYWKFQVEESKTVKGLVHIRTCYNNKYWVRKSEDSHEIVAEADEGEEDESKWNCTLFKPVFVNGDDTKMRLLHVGGLKQGGYVGTNNNNRSLSLSLSLSDEEDAGVFTVINADSTAILPEYVTFMGYNDKYVTGSDMTLQLTTTDVGERGVAHRIDYDSETHDMYIHNRDLDAQWVCLPPTSLILYNVNPSTPFVPIKVANQIALRCAAENRYVNTMTLGNGLIELQASASTLAADSILRVGEPVRSREILEASYNLDDARIYNTSSIELFKDSRTNDTSLEQDGSFNVSYKKSRTMSWKQSSTVDIGITVSWSAGIPLVGELGVEISADYSVTWEYGVEQTEEETISYTQNVRIPPDTTVTLKIVASKAYCDVPFTCRVRDLMTDGTTREYTKTDGLFVGCNAFDFQTKLI